MSINRIKNLSIEQLIPIANGEDGWSGSDQQQAKDWLEIKTAQFVLSGTIIYQSPSHYFHTDSGIHFNIGHELFKLCNLEAGQRLLCKVTKNYSGKWSSGIPTTYGTVAAVLRVLTNDQSEQTKMVLNCFSLDQEVKITDPSDPLCGRIGTIVGFTTQEPPMLVVQTNTRNFDLGTGYLFNPSQLQRIEWLQP
ncbi:hypothetical protein ACQ4M3_13485 [Leptolyngbya sp. AN03gr2]|uniref:hypothetical protein n=1 Tax=unclassified Leptolyngbya TaxID=2650499 RepID=UPI003D31CB4D